MVTFAVGKGAASVEVGDFNKDGLPDIAVADAEDSSIAILLNKGQRKFSPAASSPFFAGNFPNDINIADLNGDGIPDLAVANHERKHITVLLGNGKGQFQAAPRSPFYVKVKPHTHGVISADFNGDGYPDIATDSWAVDSIVILYGDGKGDFLNPTFYATGKHPYQRLRTADFNKDNMPDIVTTNLDENSVTILLGDGKGNFSRRFFSAGNKPFGVAVADVNGDGNLDLAVINSPSISGGKVGKDGLTILIGDGTGVFTMLEGSPFNSGMGPTRVATGDLNGDGINDIVVTNYNSRNVSIYYMGKTGLLSSTIIQVGNHPDGIAIHDMDQDGKNDIIVSSQDDNTVSILFNK
jgi:FG-GAP-like repeat